MKKWTLPGKVNVNTSSEDCANNNLGLGSCWQKSRCLFDSRNLCLYLLNINEVIWKSSSSFCLRLCWKSLNVQHHVCICIAVYHEVIHYYSCLAISDEYNGGHNYTYKEKIIRFRFVIIGSSWLMVLKIRGKMQLFLRPNAVTKPTVEQINIIRRTIKILHYLCLYIFCVLQKH